MKKLDTGGYRFYVRDHLSYWLCTGFIGMHLCKNLLQDDYIVLGVDNLNDYYDPNLKKLV